MKLYILYTHTYIHTLKNDTYKIKRKVGESKDTSKEIQSETTQRKVNRALRSCKQYRKAHVPAVSKQKKYALTIFSPNNQCNLPYQYRGKIRPVDTEKALFHGM